MERISSEASQYLVKNVFCDDLNSRLCKLFADHEPSSEWSDVSGPYPARATNHYLSLVKGPSYTDPVFMQLALSGEELSEDGDEDAMDESCHTPVPDLIHRYPEKVLITPTYNCFVHCRHCMRKRLWKKGRAEAVYPLDQWTDYIGRRPEIKEVIISGGDPLTMSDDELSRMMSLIRAISTVKHIRLHTRAPVVCPDRITDSLCAIFIKYEVKRLVTQFNHANEICPETRKVAEKLSNAGISIENQAVLLKGVNDSPESLAHLFEALHEAGVKPYYLHHPDRVKGAMHFYLSLERGLRIFRQCEKLVPHIPLPRYVVDGPDLACKTEVASIIKKA